MLRPLPSARVLVFANLVPVLGVFAFGLEARDLLLLYLAEAFVVGAFAVLRIAAASGPLRSRRFAVAVFGVHFGVFVAAYGTLVTCLANGGIEGLPLGRVPLYAFLGLFLSHAFSYVGNYHLGGEHEKAGPWRENVRPYWRIFPAHVAAVVTYALVSGVESGLWPSIVIIAVKTALDLLSHRAIHRDRALPHPVEEGQSAKAEQGLAMVAAALDHKGEDMDDGRPRIEK